MCLFYGEDKKRKDRLNSVLQIARNLIVKNDIKDVRKNPIYSFIKAITNYQLYDIIRELYEDEEVTESQSIHEDIGEYLINYAVYGNSMNNMIEDNKVDIDLSKDAVIVCAWNRERFVNALLNIGGDVGNLFKYNENNHMATYFYPIGLTIVDNGNHSILSGILKGEGIIQVNQTYDLTPTYDYMYFDGTYFRNKMDDKVMYKVRRFEIGALYEIGRILVENETT